MQYITRPTLFISTLLFSLMYSVSASAYQFGPTPITELAETEGSQNRLSLYTQTTKFEGSKLEAVLTGVSFVNSTADSSGGTSVMLRGASYKDNRTVSGGASDSTGTLFGVGVGKQWYLGQERNFGLLLNGQMDYLNFSYNVTLSNATTAKLNNSQLAFGLEGGALYRIFIDKATITPFVTVMQGSRSRNISTTSSCSNCAADYTYIDSATTIGIDLMAGKLSASILQTNASYVAKDSTTTYAAQKTTITMLVLGLNF